MMAVQAKLFCATCLAYIDGEPNYEPLGRDDAVVALCNRCAFTEVVPKEHVSAHQMRGSQSDEDRALRIKRHRDDLAARGLCTNGEKHGKATRGPYCEDCATGKRRRSAA